jgi:hypothetical protein
MVEEITYTVTLLRGVPVDLAPVGFTLFVNAPLPLPGPEYVKVKAQLDALGPAVRVMSPPLPPVLVEVAPEPEPEPQPVLEEELAEVKPEPKGKSKKKDKKA